MSIAMKWDYSLDVDPYAIKQLTTEKCFMT